MRTFLFDFDGTLVDSMPIYGAMMLRILDEQGVAYASDILKIITPLGYVGTARYFREMGVALSESELVALMHRYAVEDYTYRVPEKRGVVETLRIMKARGYSLNVLTASPHAALDPCLKRLGVFELFDHVWSCEDFGTTKSDPEIYRMAAKQMGVPVEQVIFVDDNYNADKTAKEAGMVVWGIYDASSEDYVEEMKKIDDGFAYEFEELLEI